MSVYDVVLFLHITAALVLFTMAGVLHGSEWLARRATTTAELRPLGRAMRLGVVFPITGMLLLALGIVLVLLAPASDHVGFATPFVWCGLLAWGLLTASGSVMKPHSDRVAAAISAAPDGPVTADVQEAVFDRRGVVVGHMTTFLTLATVFDMTTKPNAVVGPLALLLGLAVGAAVGGRVRPSAEVTRLTEPGAAPA